MRQTQVFFGSTYKTGTISINPNYLEFGLLGGTQTATLTVTDGWNAEDVDGYLSYLSPTSGNEGSITITVRMGKNTDVDREGLAIFYLNADSSIYCYLNYYQYGTM